MAAPFRLLQGDSLAILPTLADNSIDSIVTDPPYGLSFMGKRWDYDVPSEEIWRECLRVLKPGGHLLAFAGTRTQHRMAVRIEDAGFEIRDMIAWVYGSGFPKSHNLQGDWQGWGTALKPALEPITVARKPLQGTVAANVLAHGTGALNIDGCRVGNGEDRSSGGATGKRVDSSGGYSGGWGFAQDGVDRASGGRWPANFIHDGSDEVVGLFPQQQSGGFRLGTVQHSRTFKVAKGVEAERVREARDPDSGSAARFFYCAKASRNDRNDGCDGMPQKLGPEAGRVRTLEAGKEGGYGAPRANFHPTVKPTDLMRYLCRLVTPPGGIVLDPFMGSGSTGKAAMLESFQFIGIERDPEYLAIAEARIRAAISPQVAFEFS